MDVVDNLERFQVALAARYRIEREVGRGGMATVYLAEDLKHERNVAIKVLHCDRAAALGAERFLREIRLTAKLNHPHVLPLLDSDETDGVLYYVMPYVEGESLRARLTREERLPVDDAVQIAREVADALAYASRQGFVHRDIKPENILLSEGHAIVADFGIARAIASPNQEHLTQTGLVIGTLAYMSPEQATGDQLDERSDLYSLGCVTYEMLVGEPAFSTGNAAGTLVRRLTERAPSVRDRRPDVSEALSGAIARVMSADPDHRFRTAEQFADALRGVRDAGPAATRKSIAVLPFANLSSEPGNEYFSDGLTEELIADLSKVRSLQVISRTSAMRMKGTRDDVRTIGRKLGVRYVLEGSVRTAPSGVRITAQLIDATEDAPVWSNKFSGTAEDVFELQERVSREIVRALDLTLTPTEDRRLAARPILDQRVLDCYLRARAEINTLRADSLDRATDLLVRGLQLSPGNSLLEVELGVAEVNRAKTAAGYDERMLRQAEDRARRVVALDRELPQGSFLLGLVAFARGSLPEAAQHLGRALDLDPSYADALGYLAMTYFYAGRMTDARATADRLVAVDPLSSFSWVCDAVMEWGDGRLAAAVEASERSVAVDPQSLIAHWMRGYVLALNAQYMEAEPDDQWLTATSPDSPYRRQLSGLLHAAAGRLDAAREVLAPLDDVHLDHHESFHVAESYVMVGDVDRALNLLEAAVEQGFYPVAFIRTHNPLLHNVRSHPRFAGLIRRVEVKAAEFERAVHRVSGPAHDR